MKMPIRILCMILLAMPMMLEANPITKKWDYEKSKTIKKEFDVNADALLKIRNKYGNVDVVSWNQNRIEIEVKITVSGNNESKVNSRLQQIDVKFDSSRSEVSAKTVIENSGSKWFGNGNKMNYQIDYKVKMPVTNKADLGNDYGTISLNEIKGQAKISCDYGKILIGSLHHAENTISTDYSSNSEIEFMNGGTINADYSKMTIERANNVELNADYTDTHFEQIQNLNFSCDYGKLEVGNAHSIDGNGDYLTMDFGTVHKQLVVEADYGGIKIEKLMKGFDQVRVNADYTGIKIGLDKDAAFNFTAKLDYGGFDYKGENISYAKKVDKSTSKYYEGFVNRDNSGSRLEISAEYGNVKLYNN